MKKWHVYGYILLLCLLVWPQAASAHTGLKSAVPAKGETVTTDLTGIALTFNTVIEPMTVLTVTDEQGNDVPVKVENGKQQVQGKFEGPLSNGSYTVNWRIIGEDGHNIKGEYTFKVDKAIAQEQPALPEDKEPSASAESGTNTAAADSTAEVDDTEAGTTTDSAGPDEEQTGTTTDSADQVEVQAGDAAESDMVQPVSEAEAQSDDDSSASNSLSGRTILFSILAVILLAGFIIGIVRVVAKNK